jgi:arylsulfatase A-like enzyme
MTRKQRLIAGSIAVTLLFGWALVAFWIAPSEIARAHRGESLPFLNDLLSGRDTIALEDYLTDWGHLAARLGWFLLGASLVAYGTAELVATALGQRARRSLSERVRRVQKGGPIWSFGGILLVAVWLGVITGLLESFHTVVTHRLRPSVEVDFFAHGWEDMWMAPLVNVILLVLLAVVLYLPRLASQRLVWDRVALFTLGMVAVYGLRGHVLAGAHPWAGMLLALGAAVQMVRVFIARPERWRRIVVGSTAVLIAATGVWAGAACSAGWISQNRTVAALPAAVEGSPNILLLVLDTVRARSLGLYGYGRATSPVLDSLAAGGAVFANAMSTSSWTLPSHASMFTGRWAHELSTDWDTPLDDTYPTLGEWLTARGYVTAGFAANVGYCSPDYGLQRGFTHYDARPNSLTYVVGSTWLGRAALKYVVRQLRNSRQDLVRVTGAEIRGEFVAWLDRQDGRPWFAFLNLYDAHAPYLPPEPWLETFARPGARYWTNRAGARYSDRVEQDLIDTYDSSIAYADYELGLIIRDLARSGALDNTIIVITSDHGEEFGEHGVWQHGQSLYLPSLHVPLVFVWPGRIPAGRTLSEPVSIRALPTTLVHLVSGAEDSLFPASSLARRWASADDPAPPEPLLAELTMRDYLPETSPAGRGDLESILTDGLHFIRVGDGGEELFDVVADPWELSDLGETEAGRLEMARLRDVLSAATRDDP